MVKFSVEPGRSLRRRQIANAVFLIDVLDGTVPFFHGKCVLRYAAWMHLSTHFLSKMERKTTRVRQQTSSAGFSTCIHYICVILFSRDLGIRDDIFYYFIILL